MVGVEPQTDLAEVTEHAAALTVRGLAGEVRCAMAALSEWDTDPVHVESAVELETPRLFGQFATPNIHIRDWSALLIPDAVPEADRFAD